MKERRVRLLGFLGVTLFTFFMYFKTTAPTVVFWDVGEFLATSYILGIPHPPGTPLYVVLGKFFSMLPLPLSFFYKLLNGGRPIEPVLRITIIAITSGALTAGFIYLITVRVLEKWGGLPRTYAHLAGIFGALIGAFARTVWMNSIEAETYTPSTFVIAFLVWVALNWWEKKDDPRSIRYLLFSIYVMFLASGIHLMSLIYFPVLFFFVSIVKPKILYDWELYAVFLAFVIIILMVKLSYEPTMTAYVILLLAIGGLYYYLKVRNLLDFNNTWVIVLSLGFVVTLIGIITKSYTTGIVGGGLSVIGLYLRAKLYNEWKGFALILIFLAISFELYLIVRANHNPRINEADPSNWKSFMDVLLRKQYEPAKIFPRKIPFLHQLELYGLYFSWQYPTNGLIFILIFLALLGFVMHYMNDTKGFALIGGTFLIASLGLIIYLNLKDSPTHTLHLGNPTEVRDRDYFFAPSYTFFGLYAGFGFYELLRIIKQYAKIKLVTPVVAYSLSPLFLVWQIAYFYPRVDRSKNYIAEDYAYNILNSPDKGGILYTNGDNDTFPLWFDQEVLGVRKDVIIANLSLLNTNWYVKQLKSWGAPISFSYEDIDKLPPAMQVGNKLVFLADLMIRDMLATSAGYEPEEYVTIPPGVRVPKIYFESKEKFKEEVINGANFKVPIYFSITVAKDRYKGWEDHLLMKGLVFEVVPNIVREGSMEGVDAPYTRYKLHDDMEPMEFIEKYGEVIPPFDTYRYRGVFNDRVYKDETHEKLIRNYASISIRLGIHYDFNNQKEDALKEFKLGYKFLDLVKHDTTALLQQKIAVLLRMAELATSVGQYDSALAYYNTAFELSQLPFVYKGMAKTYLAMGDTANAISYFARAKLQDPNDRESYEHLVNLYLAKGETSQARRTAEEWVKRHPRDSSLLRILEKKR